MSVRPSVLLPFLSALALTLALTLALGPLEGIPHVSDEIVYSMQARLFAAGMRVGPPGDNPSMLLYPFWVTRPASYAIFPPGWPALLALGERAGAPWLLNPLLAAALPPLTWLLARELTDAPRAALAAALAALSPGALVLAASRMAHTSVLVALLGLTVVVVRRRDPLWTWSLAGLGAGYVVLARPFDAAILAGPLLAWGLARAPDLRRRLPLLLLPGLAAALLLADNHRLTGDPLTFPVNPWFDGWTDGERPGCNGLGFGEHIGCHITYDTWGHSPQKAARIALSNLRMLDRLLLGLPGGLLAALLGLFLAGWRRAGLALVFLVVGGYALYWSPGNAYGPRFWHPLYIALPIWAAVGAYRVLGRAAWGLLLLPGLGLARVRADLDRGYWCVDASLRALLEAGEVREGVVFLQAKGLRQAAWPTLGVDALTCDPMLESGDGLALYDPSRRSGGLQFRHALPDEASTMVFLDRYHPGAPAYLVQHEVKTNQRRLIRLR